MQTKPHPFSNEGGYLFFLPPFPDLDVETFAVDAGSCFLVFPGCLGTSSATWSISCFPAIRSKFQIHYIWNEGQTLIYKWHQPIQLWADFTKKKNHLMLYFHDRCDKIQPYFSFFLFLPPFPPGQWSTVPWHIRRDARQLSNFSTKVKGNNHQTVQITKWSTGISCKCC